MLTSLSRCCSMAAASTAGQDASQSLAENTAGARWRCLAMHASVDSPFLHQQSDLPSDRGTLSTSLRHSCHMNAGSASVFQYMPRDSAQATVKCIWKSSISVGVDLFHSLKESASSRAGQSALQRLCAHLSMDRCGAGLLQLRRKWRKMLGPPVCAKCAAHAPLSWTQCASSATSAMACI